MAPILGWWLRRIKSHAPPSVDETRTPFTVRPSKAPPDSLVRESRNMPREESKVPRG
jgi:hypothetical protein